MIKIKMADTTKTAAPVATPALSPSAAPGSVHKPAPPASGTPPAAAPGK